MDTMDQNTNNNDNGTTVASATPAAGAAPNGGTAPTNGADDMLCLMGQNQRTCLLGQWMKCMRKPALSMQYTLEKKHVPDMDDDPAGQTPVKGANADTVSVTGGFTIRYFDLAAGAMLLLAAGCMVKAMCCVRKML